MVNKVICIKHHFISSVIFILVFAIFSLSSCGVKQSQSNANTAKKPSITDSYLESSQAWQKEWENTLLDAKKEGKVVIHVFSGMPPEVRQELGNTFKAKYDLELEMITGRGAEIAERLVRERRAGLYAADLYLDGTTAIFTLIKPQGMLQPLEPMLILPEVTRPDVWFEGHLPFMDNDKFVLSFLAYASGGIYINSNFVKKDDLVSYKDLLLPAWKGKIAMNDPTVGGSGGMWFSTLGVRVLGLDYLRALAQQDVMLSRDERLLSLWLAQGRYALEIGISSGPIIEMQKTGVPITEIILKEGAYLTSGGSSSVAVYRNNPHPNATKVFVNWLLSKEGVTIVSRGQDNQSARVDVPTDFLSPNAVRKPDVPYFNTITEEYQAKQSEYQKLAREIFNLK